MSAEYLLSIVVPCYNCEKTIKTTINSLLNQIDANGNICTNYQIVLVDDGSCDSTSTICDCYDKDYGNITTVHKSNGGLVDAWKKGLETAAGKYIAFCDSDDYIDKTFVDTITKKIIVCEPDIIAFGMIIEYSNGDRDENDIYLKEGIYDEKSIKKDILPNLLSNGDMQSELLGSSRCNKVFLKKLLDKIVDDVPDDISYGEDDVTCFAAIVNSQRICAVNHYYPYHYVRNSESMIGSYDKEAFSKIERIYKELLRLAKKYDYQYVDQIRASILSLLYLGIKKEVCRNPEEYKKIKKRLNDICFSRIYLECYNESFVCKYSCVKRVFAYMIHKKMFFVVYGLTKALDCIRGRSV